MKKFALFNDLCYNSKQLYEKGKECHKDQGENFMKKALFTGAVITLLCIPSVAYAKGTAGVKFEGQNNVNVGDEFTVNMVIDNVNDTEYGIVGLGGYITYDNNVLELVNTEQGNSYEILINRNNNKIIGIDYTMENGIKERTNIFKLTFKAKAEGNTNITLTDGELEDRYDSIDFNVEDLNISSNEVIEEKPIVEEKIEVIEEKPVEIVQNNTVSDTQEIVDTDSAEIKEEIAVKKPVKKAKKVVKKNTKAKKNENGFINFFKNLFGLMFKKTTE